MQLGKQLMKGFHLDQEELALAADCYEMSNLGAIGQECIGLSGDAVTFSRSRGWEVPEDASLHGDHRYFVTDRRETGTEIRVRFEYEQVKDCWF